MTFDLRPPVMRPNVLPSTDVSDQLRAQTMDKANIMARGAQLQRQQLNDLARQYSVDDLNYFVDRNRQKQAELMDDFVGYRTKLGSTPGTLTTDQLMEIDKRKRNLTQEQSRMLNEEQSLRNGLGIYAEEIKKSNEEAGYQTPYKLDEMAKRFDLYKQTGKVPEEGFVAYNPLDPGKLVNAIRDAKVTDKNTPTQDITVNQGGNKIRTLSPDIKQWDTKEGRMETLYQTYEGNPVLKEQIYNDFFDPDLSAQEREQKYGIETSVAADTQGRGEKRAIYKRDGKTASLDEHLKDWFAEEYQPNLKYGYSEYEKTPIKDSGKGPDEDLVKYNPETNSYPIPRIPYSGHVVGYNKDGQKVDKVLNTSSYIVDVKPNFTPPEGEKDDYAVIVTPNQKDLDLAIETYKEENPEKAKGKSTADLAQAVMVNDMIQSRSGFGGKAEIIYVPYRKLKTIIDEKGGKLENFDQYSAGKTTSVWENLID